MSAVRFAPNAFLELPLRVRPPFIPSRKWASPARSPAALAAAIMAALFGDDQAVALQRQDAATERVKVLSY